MFILPDEEPPRRRGPFHRRTREQLAQEQLDSFEARFSSRG